jgi:hypothetical protein
MDFSVGVRMERDETRKLGKRKKPYSRGVWAVTFAAFAYAASQTPRAKHSLSLQDTIRVKPANLQTSKPLYARPQGPTIRSALYAYMDFGPKSG